MTKDQQEEIYTHIHNIFFTYLTFLLTSCYVEIYPYVLMSKAIIGIVVTFLFCNLKPYI
jgi:hypothetical protein